VSTLEVFAPDANGDVAPKAIIAGDKTELEGISAIAVDRNSNIYVLSTVCGFEPLPCFSKVTEYPPGSNGNIPPITVIVGDNTKLSGLGPFGLAVDTHGNIYVSIRSGFRSSIDAVFVYAAGSKGDVAPVAIIAGDKTELLHTLGLALDAEDNIYVVNAQIVVGVGVSSVTEYRAGSTGNVAPIAVIKGDQTMLFGPISVTIQPRAP
jgi:hypothetical protein